MESMAEIRRTATILVVDDVEPLRRLLRWKLEEAGYAAVEAADGRAALQVLEETPVDLILLDILMPGMEGIETIGVLPHSSPSENHRHVGRGPDFSREPPRDCTGAWSISHPP